MARPVAAAQGALGATLAVRPDLLMPLVCGRGARPAAWIVRVLGARMSLQAAATLARPDPEVVLAGAVTDALHGASMLALARLAPRYRRPALASAATAFGFGLAAAATFAGDRA